MDSTTLSSLHLLLDSTIQDYIFLGLLTWMSMEDGIPVSFTNFVTSPELSGPLHISPVVYHTQITQYSLQSIYQWARLCIEHLPNCYFVRTFSSLYHYILNSDWSYRHHLSRALPTKGFFIYSNHFVQNDQALSHVLRMIFEISAYHQLSMQNIFINNLMQNDQSL